MIYFEDYGVVAWLSNIPFWVWLLAFFVIGWFVLEFTKWVVVDG